jgi:archaellum component FlaC
MGPEVPGIPSMQTSNEDLVTRLERLEHDVGDLSSTVSRMVPAADRTPEHGHAMWGRIPFAAWLKLSGPTFAVMALGFTLLWNAQQATQVQILEVQRGTQTQLVEMQRANQAQFVEMQRAIHAQLLEMQEATHAQLLEMNRSIGRLEGAIDALTATVEDLRDSVERLAERVAKLES